MYNWKPIPLNLITNIVEGTYIKIVTSTDVYVGTVDLVGKFYMEILTDDMKRIRKKYKELLHEDTMLFIAV